MVFQTLPASVLALIARAWAAWRGRSPGPDPTCSAAS